MWAITPNLLWMLGIPTQIIMILQPAYYWLSPLPNSGRRYLKERYPKPWESVLNTVTSTHIFLGNSLHCPLELRWVGGGSLKDGLTATKTSYSSRVPRLDSQHPCDDLQWYAAPVLGIWPPLASVNTMHAWATQHKNRQNTHILNKDKIWKVIY